MSEYSRTKNSMLNLLSGMGGQILSILFKFVTRTVFISCLGKEYLGINGLFSNILTMLSLTELGLDTAINFKLYMPIAQKDDKRVRVLMKFYKNAYRVVGFAVLLIGLLLIPFLRYLINDYDSLAALGINAGFVFVLYLLQSASSYLFFAYKSAIVKAAQKEYLLNLVGYIVTFVSNVVEILILVIWKSFIWYTVSIVLFTIVQNFVNAIIAERFYPSAFIKEEESIEKSEVRDIFKDLGALFVYKVNGVVLKATDNLVLSAFIGLGIVGIYSNYLMIYTALKTLFGKVYNSVKASMGNLFAVGSLDQKYAFFKVMNFASSIVYGTACIGITVVADEFIECWIGKSYVIAQPFSLLMGIEIIFVGIKLNLGQVRNVSGAFRQMWFRPVLGIIINLGVSIALVKSLGICGVLIGTIVADFSTNFLVDPYIIYKYSFDGQKKLKEFYIVNLKYAVILIVVGALDYWLCRHLLVSTSWVSVGLHSIICGITVPAAFLILFRKSDECRYLISKLQKLKRRFLKA